jgi:hypothetical protein
VLDRLADVLAQVGKRDDLFAPVGDLRRREAEQRSREIDVGEPRVVGMEARAQLEQRADAAVDDERAARGLITEATTLSNVDLPAPFSPMIASDCPRSRRATRRPAQ